LRYGGRIRSLSPRLALALAVIAISWGSILARLCEAGPLVVACYRMAVAALLLFPFVMRQLPSLVEVPGFLAAVTLAGALLAVHFGAWIWSLSLTSIGSSVVLVSCQPLFSALFSGWVLREKAPARIYAGSGVSLLGILVISRGDWGLSTRQALGDFLALLAASAGAACFVVGRSIRHRVGFMPYFFCLCAVGAVILAAAAMAAGQSLLGLGSRDAYALLGLAIVPTLLGHGCLNWAVRHLPVYTVSLAAFGEPVLATIYARVFFLEPIRPSLILGATFIGAGILICLLRPALRPQGAS
jgi:drug/metabolite transporter (DMT)-like permease